MSVVERVRVACREQMSEIADRICADYKATVDANLKHPGNSSGEASGSIHVEQFGEYAYRIGSNNLHLYFFEEGNGSGGIPKHGRPRRPMPLTFGSRGAPQGYAMHVSNCAGKHCNKIVADRYR